MTEKTKRIFNQKGFALLYVVMAVMAIAVICVTVSLLASNLYARTATVSAQQQAMIMSKSVAKAFANEYIGDNATRFLQYLQKGFCPDCRVRLTYSKNEGLYRCPSCSKRTSPVANESITVTARVDLLYDSTILGGSVPNKEYLPNRSFTDVTLRFYLDDTCQYLLGDVTVSYNGATATTTLVMSYLDDSSFDDTMYTLFTYYNMYLTNAGGSHFTYSGKEDASEYPVVGLYSDHPDEIQNYYLERDMFNDITTIGDWNIESKGDTYMIKDNVTAHGDLYISQNVRLPADDDPEDPGLTPVHPINIYCSGDLTLGSATKTGTVYIDRNVYCEGDVTIYGNVVFGTDYKIVSQGNVFVYDNGTVGDISCETGNVTVENATVGSINTEGAVSLSKNSIVNGSIYCCGLIATDSNVTGSIHVSDVKLEQSGISIKAGDMQVILTSIADSDKYLGAGDGSIYVKGALTIRREVSDYTLNLSGTVQASSLADPVQGTTYPYRSNIHGDLVLDEGVTITKAGAQYKVNYLIGLMVLGDVWMPKAFPLFTGGASAGDLSTDIVSSDSWKLPQGEYTSSLLDLTDYSKEANRTAKATVVTGTLFAEQSLAFSTALEDTQFFGGDFDKNNYYVMPTNLGVFVCMQNAILNNIHLGNQAGTKMYNLAVWGGKIFGNVHAHHIRLAYVWAQPGQQSLLATDSSGVPGSLSLNSIATDSEFTFNQGSDPQANDPSGYEFNVLYENVDFYATGNLSVRYGVTVFDNCTLVCKGNAYLYGSIGGKIVVGTTANTSKVYVGPYAELTQSDWDHALFVSGRLESLAQGGVVSVREKTAMVTGEGVINGKMNDIYANADQLSGNAYFVGHELGSASGGSALTLNDKVVIIRSGSAPNSFHASAGGAGGTSYTITKLYVGSAKKVDYSLLNETADTRWYIQTDCTINGTLATAGYLFIKEGVTVTVEGNLRAKMVITVSDPSDSYLSNPSPLLSIDVVDNKDLGPLNASGLVVHGNMELDTSKRSFALHNISVNKTLYVNRTLTEANSIVTLDNCSIGWGVCVYGSRAGNLVLVNSNVGGQASEDLDIRKTQAVVRCNDLTMTDSIINGFVYASGNSVILNGSSQILYSLFAESASVVLHGTSAVASAASASISDSELRTLLAKSVSGDSGTHIGNPTNGAAMLYIVGAATNSFYANKLDTVVTMSQCYIYSDEGYSNEHTKDWYATNKQHIKDGDGVNIDPVKVRNKSILTGASGDNFITQIKNKRNDLTWGNANGAVEFKAFEGDTPVDLLHWDDIQPKPSAATYLEMPKAPEDAVIWQDDITDNPHMSLDNHGIWNPRVIALRWIFPFVDDYISDYVAYTNKGEEGGKVYVNNNANGSLRMLEPAYYNITWSGNLSAIGERLSNKFKVDFLNVFNEKFKEYDTHIWDIFGLFGDSPIVAVAKAFAAAIASFTNGLYETITSSSAVSDWAGVGMQSVLVNDEYVQYPTGQDEFMRYNLSLKGKTNISNARNGKDILVVSTQTVCATGSLYDVLHSEDHPFIKKAIDWLAGDDPENNSLVKMMRSIAWGSWSVEWCPAGVFFFESGYVPEEVFNSYTDYTHQSWAAPSADKNYRENYDTARDGLGRWYWGGQGTVSGSVSDCTWTFFTCTDINDPYKEGTAKDLHIVLPKHTYMAWKADSQNNVHIIGNGRVFLYLQEDTNILIAGKDMPGTDVHNIFGGLRYVELDSHDETKYRYDVNGEKVGVYLDATGPNRQKQPRIFIIGTGPNIHLEIRDFTVAAYIYMPNGNSYTGRDGIDETVYSNGVNAGGVTANYAKDNILYITSTASGNKNIDIYGMYVADKLSTSPTAELLKDYNPDITIADDMDFANVADSKIRYYKTKVDLSNTVMKYGSSVVTKARADGMYQLREFWEYPPNLLLEDMHFYYFGVKVD